MTAAEVNVLRSAYEAFNRRDIDAVLALMHPDVEWPDMMEGRTLAGTDAVRNYWTRQFEQIDSHVEPVEFAEHNGEVVVRVHQVVRNKDGAVVSDGVIEHHYQLSDGKVMRMKVVAR